MKRFITKTSRDLLVLMLVTAWVFSGFPHIRITSIDAPLPEGTIRLSTGQLQQVRIARVVHIAHADTSGPNNPGLSTAAATLCSDNMAWSGTGSPGGTGANDTTYVSYTAGNWDAGNPTDELRVSDFGFNVDLGATIDGIQVDVLAWTPAGSGTERDVFLFTTPGTTAGDDKAITAFPIPDADPGSTYQSHGGTTDTWNAGLNSAQINNSSFGVSLCWTSNLNNSHINVDHVRIAITYTPPATVVPTVATNAETNVTATGATLNGNISATGGENATVRGFAWGTSSTLQDAFGTSTESGSFGTDTFSDDVSGLIAGSTYFYRAYASNSAGTGYGTIESLVAGTDTSITRSIRLFEGFMLKLLNGTIKLFQR